MNSRGCIVGDANSDVRALLLNQATQFVVLAALFGAGYDYTYLYPGVQKVVQAAGRVIRTQSDEGTLFLIDDRFAEPKVQQLLLRWWRLG